MKPRFMTQPLGSLWDWMSLSWRWVSIGFWGFSWGHLSKISDRSSSDRKKFTSSKLQMFFWIDFRVNSTRTIKNPSFWLPTSLPVFGFVTKAILKTGTFFPIRVTHQWFVQVEMQDYLDELKEIYNLWLVRPRGPRHGARWSPVMFKLDLKKH